MTLDNFRCAHFPNVDPDRTNGQCQYVLRAKRLNALPDAVELVFLDDPHDFRTPSIPSGSTC